MIVFIVLNGHQKKKKEKRERKTISSIIILNLKLIKIYIILKKDVITNVFFCKLLKQLLFVFFSLNIFFLMLTVEVKCPIMNSRLWYLFLYFYHSIQKTMFSRNMTIFFVEKSINQSMKHKGEKNYIWSKWQINKTSK